MSRFYEALKEATRLPVERPPERTGVREENRASGLRAAENLLAPDLPAQHIPKPEPAHTRTAEPPAAASAPLIYQPSDIETVLQSIAPLQEELSPVPASVAVDESARVIQQAVDPIVVEHYRRLRTKILQEQSANPFRALLVASPSAREGKTVTVLNLGYSFAMLPGFKIAIVDGDLRKGSLGKWLNLEGRAGLSDLVEGTAKLEDVVLKSDESPLHFVMRGNSQIEPAELLHSPNFTTQLQRMAQYFDLILVDSPPVNLLTDAQLLAGGCDAVLLLVRAFVTTRKSLEKAYQEMAAFRVIGTVFNGGSHTQTSGGYYYGYKRPKK